MSVKNQTLENETVAFNRPASTRLERPVISRVRIRKTASLRPLKSTSKLKSVRPERVTLGAGRKSVKK